MTSAKSWHKIGQLTDIPRLGARCVLTPFGRLAVFRTADDEVYAIEDRCPHKGGQLPNLVPRFRARHSAASLKLERSAIGRNSWEATAPLARSAQGSLR